MYDVQLTRIERLSRRVLLGMTLGHLALLIYAVQTGQSIDAYLQFARQNLALAALNGVLVLAAAAHAAIGLRAIVTYTLGVTGMVLNSFAMATFWGLSATGTFGVIAIYSVPPS